MGGLCGPRDFFSYFFSFPWDFGTVFVQYNMSNQLNFIIMQSCSKVVVKEVVGQILNMYNNNILYDNGNESFENWCENGEVFAGLDYEDECIELMEEISPYVNKLTAVLENFVPRN